MLGTVKRSILRTVSALGINPPDLAYRREAIRKFVWRIQDREIDKNKLMVNIGGTRFYKRHWKVLDYRHPETRHYDFPGLDYNFDLLSGAPLPFKDESVAIFYSSHTFEHLLEAYIPPLVAELYRCLKRGGAVRLTMPDFDNLYNAFLREDWFTVMNISGTPEYDRFRGAVRLYGETAARQILSGWPDKPRIAHGPYEPDRIARHFIADFGAFHEGEMTLAQLQELAKRTSKEEFANTFTMDTPIEWKRRNPQTHTVWFNYDKLSRLLKQAGFKTVYKSAPFESKFPEMVGVGKYWSFDHIRTDTGLYVEAVK